MVASDNEKLLSQGFKLLKTIVNDFIEKISQSNMLELIETIFKFAISEGQ